MPGALLAILLLAAGGGCGSDGEKGDARAAGLALGGVYPRFDPGLHRYVSRCGRAGASVRVRPERGVRVTAASGPPRTGSFRVPHGAEPGADFAVAAVGDDQRRAYRVRCLPADFPRWRFQRFEGVAPGTFTVSFNDGEPWIVVFDHSGTPRWWFKPPTRALWAQVLANGRIAWSRSFGDGYGLDPRMAFEVRSLSGRLRRVVRSEGAIVDGHEFNQLGNGNVLIDAYPPGGDVDLTRFGGPARTHAVFAEIQEVDPEGRVVWRWNSRGRIGLGETGRWWRNVLSNPKAPAGADQYDPVHINSIDLGPGGEVVMSTRHTDAVYGIDRASGRIEWKLGGTPTPESMRVAGDPARKLFGGQHDVRLGSDGVLSIFDNGKDRPRLPRVVFYRLDPERRTATYLGQLNDPRVHRSHCCGSARPLPGDGWLVSWGDNPVVSAFDEDGRMAFRLTIPAPSFRAVPVPAEAAGIAAFDRGMEAMEP